MSYVCAYVKNFMFAEPAYYVKQSCSVLLKPKSDRALLQDSRVSKGLRTCWGGTGLGGGEEVDPGLGPSLRRPRGLHAMENRRNKVLPFAAPKLQG